MAQSSNTVGISAVTVEESLRGRVAALSQARDGPKRILRYRLLVDTLRFLNSLDIVPFDQGCEDEFQRLRALPVRIGTQDLKIAAVALVNQLTLVTRNRSDFGHVPGLAIDDWSR
jgi:tRNA(fMet)-specific endonuclease VapC